MPLRSVDSRIFVASVTFEPQAGKGSFLLCKTRVRKCCFGGSPGGAGVENLPANAGDARHTGLIPGSGRSPGGGNSHSFQCSCLENPRDRGARRAAVHGWQSQRPLSTKPGVA